MTNYNKRLDEILDSLYIESEMSADDYGKYWIEGKKEAKQAILRWAADEVIGKKENTRHLESPAWNVVGGRNELRGEQMKILTQHGYKGDQL